MVTAKAALKHLHNTLANAGLGDKAASDAELQNLSTELQDFVTPSEYTFTVTGNNLAVAEAVQLHKPLRLCWILNLTAMLFSQ